ncbi:hypothetical protein AAG747_14705 [Rapidithrix thailandica]|uniref:Uncharacterized protein n=1 Tax=Rapidithrix thailandica TaxID=413964 RepID=A0AAW9SEP3_9BACT
MLEITDLRASSLLLSKDFEMDEIRLPDNPEDAFRHLHKLLSQKIGYLLDHDFERLMSICYIIDLKEEKVKEILSGLQAGNIAENLANLIIQRQLQKVEIRRKYSPPS